MADVEHSTIASANCHEPKHISTASTSDTGKVITPSSTTSGESELRQLNLDDFDHSNCHHISIHIIANSSADAITIAGDTTLHTSADFNAITRFTEDTVNAKQGFSFNPSTGEITCNLDGTYKGDLWLAVSSDTNSTLIGVRYGVGGDYFAGGASPVVKGLSRNAGEISPLSGFGETILSDGDVITVGIAANKSCNLTIHEAAVVLRRVD